MSSIHKHARTKYSRDDTHFLLSALSLWLRLPVSRREISAYWEDILNSFAVFLPSTVPLFVGVRSLLQFSMSVILKGKEVWGIRWIYA